MEVSIKCFTHCLSLRFGLIDLWHKGINIWSEIFLIHHIEANHFISIFFSFESCINLHLDVVFSNDF